MDGNSGPRRRQGGGRGGGGRGGGGRSGGGGRGGGDGRVASGRRARSAESVAPIPGMVDDYNIQGRRL
jgi:hypothetical protein